jgi:hypothetical protein
MKKSGGMSVGTQIVSFKETILGEGSWLIINDDNSTTIDYVASVEDAILHILKLDDLPMTITFRKHSEIRIGSQVLVYDRSDVEMIDDHDCDKEYWNKK